MAVYTNDLRLKEIGTGDESGTWGVSTNLNLSNIAAGFSYGTLEVAADSNETFTMPDGTASDTRAFYLKFTSAGSLTATRTLTLGPNTISKVWIIENATSGSQSIVISQGSGSTVTIANGATAFVHTDGAGAGAAVTNSLTTTQFVTPILGTPTSATLTNATGLPISTGVAGLGTGVATFLATPSSSNLAAAVTDETGSGALVFGTSPTLATPVLGTPTSVTLTNATGLPLSTGVTGTLPVANGGTGIAAIGTGVATAWGVDIGSAGAMVLYDGALGTPSAGTATNLTGLPLSTGVTGTLPLANGGTAATTAAGARASILNSFAGNAGYALVVNVGETDTEWAVTPGVGSVTSVDVSGGTTGLTTSGGPITAAGTITLAGTLAVANGGTGITSFGTGVATALGVNVGSAGAFLTFNGDAGTPSALVATNATGLPVSTGISGLGTGVATALAVNVGSAGAPVVFNGDAGTPSALVLTNASGLPLTTGVTGTLPIANGGTGITAIGTGVATAWGVNIGSAGAMVLYDGALGTPTSGTLTNCTGLPAAGVTGTAAILGANTFTAAQIGTVTALTSASASIAINLATTNNFSHTLTEDTTLAAPSNPVAGQSGIITFTQDASSPKTLAYNTFWKFAGGTIPELTATNSAVDVFAYYVESASRATCQLIKDVK